MLAFGGCSSGGSTPSSPTTTSASGSAATSVAPLRVDLIGPAVAALEAKLGGPQQYFEINANAKVVNLFVALNDAKLAQPWLYFDGKLSNSDPKAAQGATFVASALPTDPAVLLSQIGTDLPGTQLDLIEVRGGPAGAVQFTVAATSSKGGQLLVEVGPDGKIVSVDPN